MLIGGVPRRAQFALGLIAFGGAWVAGTLLGEGSSPPLLHHEHRPRATVRIRVYGHLLGEGASQASLTLLFPSIPYDASFSSAQLGLDGKGSYNLALTVPAERAELPMWVLASAPNGTQAETRQLMARGPEGQVWNYAAPDLTLSAPAPVPSEQTPAPSASARKNSLVAPPPGWGHGTMPFKRVVQ